MVAAGGLGEVWGDYSPQHPTNTAQPRGSLSRAVWSDVVAVKGGIFIVFTWGVTVTFDILLYILT